MPATSGGPDRGMAAPEVPPGLGPGMRWRRVFSGEERQLGALRRWLKVLLPESPARDDLASVATELASNSIRHTASGRGGWFAVEITWHAPIVRVAVADCGGPTEPRVIEDPAAEHGRGLLLVRGLSVRTGVCGDQRGRLVWADIRWESSDLASRPVAGDAYEQAVHDGEAALARRFGGMPAWFGRSTLQWWALADPGQLVSAPSAQELATLLYRLAGTARTARPLAVGQRAATAGERADSRRSREADVPPWRREPDARPHPSGSGFGHLGGQGNLPGTPGGNPGRRALPGGPRPVAALALRVAATPTES